MLTIQRIEDWAPAAPPDGWEAVEVPGQAGERMRAYHSKAGTLAVLRLERRERRCWLQIRVTGPMWQQPTRGELDRVQRAFLGGARQLAARGLVPRDPRHEGPHVSLLYRIRGGR